MKKIKTFEDACKAIKADPATVLPDLSAYPASLQKQLTAVAKLLIINAAINGDWEPVYTSEEEPRHYPTWNMEKCEDNPTGFGLYHASDDYTLLTVPARFTFRTEKMAEYAAEQFKDIYLDIMKSEETQQADKERKHRIEEIVDELKTIHAKLAPIQLKKGKVKPATDDEIATLEEMIGEPLPFEFVAYLKAQSFRINMNGGYSSMTVNQIIDNLSSMNKLLKEGIFDDGRVEDHIKRKFGNWDGNYLKTVWWSTKWVPFGIDGCGNMVCIDLDPGEKGSKGQIMWMEIQEGQGPYISRYYSFGSFMAHQLQFLKDKHYSMVEYGENEFWVDINEDKTAD